MSRPPRNADVDRLVTTQLIFFAYFQIGVFQALAGFYSFFVVLNDYGFRIGSVFGSNPAAWMPYSDNDKITRKEWSCPCGGNYPQTKFDGFQTNEIPMYCGIDEGADPIVLKSADKQECSDVYDWLNSKNKNWEEECTFGISNGGETLDAAWPYGWGCPYGTQRPEKKCKFDDSASIPDTGLNPCYKATEALKYAQTAAFVSIVIVQWADLIICKTRSLSLYQQGMSNTVMLFGLLSETLLCVVLCYFTALGYLLNTRPLQFIHWMPSMPYSILIFTYDEVRKYFLRRGRITATGKGSTKKGFVEKYSYY